MASGGVAGCGVTVVVRIVVGVVVGIVVGIVVVGDGVCALLVLRSELEHASAVATAMPYEHRFRRVSPFPVRERVRT